MIDFSSFLTYLLTFVVASFSKQLDEIASATLGSGLIGRAPSKTQQSVGLFILIGGATLLIIAMASIAWFTVLWDTTSAGVTTNYNRRYIQLPLVHSFDCSLAHLVWFY
jgi:hypothetical protein